MADNNEEGRIDVDSFDFANEGASEETPMLVNYLITRLQQAMANPALQGEVQQQLQAYGFIPPHQEERIPEKSLGETSKRGTSKVREGENPYKELRNLLLDDAHQSRRRGHAQRQEPPSKEKERSESPDESMEEDVAPRRRRVQKSPTPPKRKRSPHSPPRRESKKEEKDAKKKKERKRSPSSPSSSPSSSSDESGGSSSRESTRRGHRRSHAAWRKSGLGPYSISWDVCQWYDECGGQLNPKKCHLAQPRVKLLGHVISEYGIEADLEKLLYPLQQVVKNDPLEWTKGCEDVFVDKVKEVLSTLPIMQAPDWENEFYVNPSVGDDAIGAMLLQRGKESQYMKLVHYASRVKTLHERDYSKIEMVMTSMVYACRRFRHYLLQKSFTFLTGYSLLPHLFNNLNISKILMNWVIELQKFQFTFLVEESTRATLADLLTYKENPVLIKEEVVQKKKVETFAISNASMLYFDGSYRRSHDAASRKNFVYDAQGNFMRKQGLKLDEKSNNEAEYMALEGGLHIYVQMGIKRLQIKGDALLVVKQVLGVWKNKNLKLKNLCFRVKALLKKFEAWSLQHIKRSQNEEAHEATQGMITCVFVVKICCPLSPNFDGSVAAAKIPVSDMSDSGAHPPADLEGSDSPADSDQSDIPSAESSCIHWLQC
ncbi:hypothetical protein L7F22_024102 [Adiantum nelumboides]|nr:hypothetical protein [Adiantum nelumboides]